MSSNPHFAAQPRLRPGDTVRLYCIVRLVGVGGMGAVYEAENTDTGERVALKEILFHPEELTPVEYERLQQSFQKEARVLIHLDRAQVPPDGAAIPKAYEFFQEEDHWYLVMEYVEGQTLADALAQNRGQPLPMAQVRGWLLQLLTTLDYLHRQEPPLIHRDIKPSNLKVNVAGWVTLLDFGIAKGGSASTGHTQLYTQSVQFFSPHYSPPEQLRGKGTDARTDLFGAAATAYYLLSGTPPPTTETRSYAIIEGDGDPLVPLHTVNREVTRSFSRAIQAALALKTEERPATAAVFYAMIAGEESPLPPPPPPPVKTDPALDQWGAPINRQPAPAVVPPPRRQIGIPLWLIAGIVAVVVLPLLGTQLLRNTPTSTEATETAGQAAANGAGSVVRTATLVSRTPTVTMVRTATSVATEIISTRFNNGVVAEVTPTARAATSTPLRVATVVTPSTTTTIAPSTTPTPGSPTVTPPPPATTVAVPSSTPLVLPSATTPPPASSTPAVAARPPIALVQPLGEAGFTLGSTIIFQWSGGGELRGSEYFDLRIWREGEPHFGKAAAGSPVWQFSTNALGAGRWCWSVAVVDNGGATVLADEAAARCFTISGVPDGGGDPGSNPEPTPPPTPPPPPPD